MTEKEPAKEKPETIKQRCSVCLGSGQVVLRRPSVEEEIVVYVKCGLCKGTGYVEVVESRLPGIR